MFLFQEEEEDSDDDMTIGVMMKEFKKDALKGLQKKNAGKNSMLLEASATNASSLAPAAVKSSFLQESLKETYSFMEQSGINHNNVTDRSRVGSRSIVADRSQLAPIMDVSISKSFSPDLSLAGPELDVTAPNVSSRSALPLPNLDMSSVSRPALDLTSGGGPPSPIPELELTGYNPKLDLTGTKPKHDLTGTEPKLDLTANNLTSSYREPQPNKTGLDFSCLQQEDEPDAAPVMDLSNLSLQGAEHRDQEAAESSLSASVSRLNLTSLDSVQDPFDEALQVALLSKIPVGLSQRHGYVRIGEEVPRVRSNKEVQVGENAFLVGECKGAGAYGKVFKAMRKSCADSFNSTIADMDVVLKIQKPACEWEFYIGTEIHRRLKDELSRSFFMSIPRCFTFDDGSILVSEHMQVFLIHFIFLLTVAFLTDWTISDL